MDDDFLPHSLGKEIEWIELNLLRKFTSISKSTILSILQDTADEDTVDSWISELELRNSMLTKPYYEFEGNTITPLLSWQDCPEYYLCLHFACYGASKDTVGTRLFERISAIALKNFIGGEVYALGFPNEGNLNTHLDEIALKCFETRGMQANSDYKDDGVDVICYKSFNDNKSSNLYVLLQCAAGIHWKTKKTIELDRWSQYIYWTRKNIITSISTAEHVKKSQWEKSATDFGIIMDRTRINNWYINAIDADIRNEAIDWYNGIVL
jgi:hypothetical protein